MKGKVSLLLAIVMILSISATTVFGASCIIGKTKYKLWPMNGGELVLCTYCSTFGNMYNKVGSDYTKLSTARTNLQSYREQLIAAKVKVPTSVFNGLMSGLDAALNTASVVKERNAESITAAIISAGDMITQFNNAGKSYASIKPLTDKIAISGNALLSVEKTYKTDSDAMVAHYKTCKSVFNEYR